MNIFSSQETSKQVTNMDNSNVSIEVDNFVSSPVADEVRVTPRWQTENSYSESRQSLFGFNNRDGKEAHFDSRKALVP